MTDNFTAKGTSEYRITSLSNLAAFVAVVFVMFLLFVLIAIVVGVSLVVDIGVAGIVAAVAIVMVGFFFVLRYVFTRLLAQSIVATLMKDGLDVRYLRKPFFDRVRNVYVHLTDIKSYQVYTHPAPRLVLELHNGKRLRYGAPNIGDNSQFASLVTDFAEMVEGADPTSKALNPIVRKKTIYEGTSGLVLATFFILISVVILYAIFFMPDAHETKDVIFALGAMFTALGYVAHIFMLRKKKNEQG